MYAIDTKKWNFSSSNASIVMKMKGKEDEEGWWNENLFVKCDMMRMILLNCKKSWDFILSIVEA